MNELRAGRAPAHVIEDRIADPKRPRIAREGFERFVRWAADTLRIRILALRNFFHVPKDFFKREIVWCVRRHRLSIFASWNAPGQA